MLTTGILFPGRYWLDRNHSIFNALNFSRRSFGYRFIMRLWLGNPLNYHLANLFPVFDKPETISMHMVVLLQYAIV